MNAWGAVLSAGSTPQPVQGMGAGTAAVQLGNAWGEGYVGTYTPQTLQEQQQQQQQQMWQQQMLLQQMQQTNAMRQPLPTMWGH